MPSRVLSDSGRHMVRKNGHARSGDMDATAAESQLRCGGVRSCGCDVAVLRSVIAYWLRRMRSNAVHRNTVGFETRLVWELGPRTAEKNGLLLCHEAWSVGLCSCEDRSIRRRP
jgi:hypothetical protein